MQTRSSTSAEIQSSSGMSKTMRYQALMKSLKNKSSVQKAKEEARLAKKREQKRLQKERIVFQKQQLKSRCRNSTFLNFFGEFAESDEQIKTRLHSHLLTGRLQNKAL